MQLQCNTLQLQARLHRGLLRFVAFWGCQVFKQTIKEKGVGGLFTGMGPRVTQTAVMSAVFFSLFEFWKAQLKGCACAFMHAHMP